MSAPHNSHGNHVTDYRACGACFAYSLVLDGLCHQCTLQLKRIILPTTTVRIFDLYLVAVGPWVIAGLA